MTPSLIGCSLYSKEIKYHHKYICILCSDRLVASDNHADSAFFSLVHFSTGALVLSLGEGSPHTPAKSA